jgi:hypothetical protein
MRRVWAVLVPPYPIEVIGSIIQVMIMLELSTSVLGPLVKVSTMVLLLVGPCTVTIIVVVVIPNAVKVLRGLYVVLVKMIMSTILLLAHVSDAQPIKSS